MKRLTRLLLFALIINLIAASCSGAATPTAPDTAPTQLPATHTAPPAPTVTSAPTNTPLLPTETPTARPTATVSPDLMAYINPKKYEVTYSATVKNSGFDLNELRVYLPMPIEWEAQKDLKLTEASPKPAEQGIEKISGNGMVYWLLSSTPKNGTSAEFKIVFTFTAYETVTHIDPSAVQPYQKDNADYQRFIRPEKYIEASDAEIMKIASEVAGDETNPYLLAKKYYDYVIDHAKYELLGKGLNGARSLLTDGVGECGDYSALFIALARAKNIPARPVVGYWAISGNEQTHVWAEFYLEGLGWIPVDPTIGQQGPEARAYYFGNMDNQRVILSKGYNSRLTPPGPEDYIASLIQVPFWWYWGDGDGEKMSLSQDWVVKPIQ